MTWRMAYPKFNSGAFVGDFDGVIGVELVWPWPVLSNVSPLATGTPLGSTVVGHPRADRSAEVRIGGLDGDRAAVEGRQRKTMESLVEALFHVAEDAQRHRFAEAKARHRVRAPVDAGHVASAGDVPGELVQFSADRELTSAMRHQRQTVGSHIHRIVDGKRFIEESLEHGRASAGDGGMPTWIRRMERRTLGVSVRQKKRSVGFANRSQSRRAEHSLVDRIFRDAGQLQVHPTGEFLRPETSMN